jgi:putative ABC transport system permease protein
MRLLPFDYSVRNLGRSPIRLGAIVLASCLVVCLTISAYSFIRGMDRTLTVRGGQSNVILLAAGSEESVERSQIAASSAAIVAAEIDSIKTQLGIPYVSPEIFAAIIVHTHDKGGEEYRALIRGFTQQAFLVHPRVQIVEGRIPKSGENEIMIGGLVGRKIGVDESLLGVGNSLWFDNRSWKIVGRFRAPSTVMDAEIWTPLSDLQVATKRDALSSVVVTLGDGEFEDIDGFTKLRFDLGLSAIRESDYYSSLMEFYKPVHAMIWATALLTALVGVVGGLNTMYAAFATRVRELGMLQSLGFSTGAIVISLMQESVLASMAGTLIASALCLLFLDGLAVRFSMGVFQLSVDNNVLLLGMITGLAMGIIGALPPALRCLRFSIPDALKAT